MKCEEIQRMVLENGGRDLPTECLEHLVGCATCRQVHERTVIVSKLLALKQHEHPDPMFETRNVASIRSRLEKEQGAAAGWFEGAWITGAIRPWHGWAAGAVAACLTLAAVWIAPHAGTSPAQPAFAEQPAPAAPEAPTAKPDPNDPAWNKPMFVIKEPGPDVTHPGDIRFGNSNGPSRAVEFQQGTTPFRPQD